MAKREALIWIKEYEERRKITVSLEKAKARALRSIGIW